MTNKQTLAIEKLRMNLAIDNTPLPEIKFTRRDRENFKYFSDKYGRSSRETDRQKFVAMSRLAVVQNYYPCMKHGFHTKWPSGEIKLRETKLKKPIKPEDLYIGCLNCSTATLRVKMNRIFYYGTTLYRDGRILWAAKNNDNPKNGVSARMIENLAARYPYCDWRIEFRTPMHGEVFQRHGKNLWVCIESNDGYA